MSKVNGSSSLLDAHKELSKHGAAHQHPTKPRHLESSFFAITMHGYVHILSSRWVLKAKSLL